MSDIFSKLLSSQSSKPAQGAVYPLPSQHPYGGHPYGQQPYGAQAYGQPPYPQQPQYAGHPYDHQQPYPPPPYHPSHNTSYSPPPPPQQYHQNYQQPPPQPQPQHQSLLPSSFTVRPSPKKTKSTTSVIHPLGAPVDSPALYSIITHEYSKPNVTLHPGDASLQNNAPVLADAVLHTFSSTTELTLRGAPFTMRQSSLSGSFTIECPGLGSFKWKSSDSGGLKLVDGSGRKVARIKSAGFMKFSEKEVHILIPGDQRFVEMVLVTAAAARILNKAALEVAGEVVGAVAGA